jgi:DNA (cytosine-5)-methyltransferase 1
MVSFLGDYYYDFPKPKPLTLRLKDMLEENVDESFYLSERAIEGIKNTTFNTAKLENRTEKNGIMSTLLARDYKDPKLVMEEPLVWDGYNQQVRADSSVVGTLTRNCGADLKRNGQGIIEVQYDT